MVVPLALFATACSDDDDDVATTGQESSGGGSGDSSAPTIEITTPADGDDVAAPLEIGLESNAEIGETDTGLQHFHVHYDGDQEDYQIVYAEGPVMADRDLSEGEHTIEAVLANADHSETDVTQEITVNVTGEGAGTGGGGGGDTTTTDPYGY